MGKGYFSASHAGDRGSTPLGTTINSLVLMDYFTT